MGVVEKIFLLGHPGSGKSTLANALRASHLLLHDDLEVIQLGFSGYEAAQRLFQEAEKELEQRKKFSLCHELGHFAPYYLD